MKRKRNRANRKRPYHLRKPTKDCFNCDNCEYIGEGAYICSQRKEPIIVIDQFQPTKDFNNCNATFWRSL